MFHDLYFPEHGCGYNNLDSLIASEHWIHMFGRIWDEQTGKTKYGEAGI